jgi:hypothetical protein
MGVNAILLPLHPFKRHDTNFIGGLVKAMASVKESDGYKTRFFHRG